MYRDPLAGPIIVRIMSAHSLGGDCMRLIAKGEASAMQKID